MEPKKCENCKRPVSLKVCCRWCNYPVPPMKLETIVLILGGILTLGVVIGSLVFLIQ